MRVSGAFIYIIENSLNGKIYVGVSNSPKRRFSEHKNDAKGNDKLFYLQAAMKQHITAIDDVFKMSIIEYFDMVEAALL